MRNFTDFSGNFGLCKICFWLWKWPCSIRHQSILTWLHPNPSWQSKSSQYMRINPSMLLQNTGKTAKMPPQKGICGTCRRSAREQKRKKVENRKGWLCQGWLSVTWITVEVFLITVRLFTLRWGSEVLRETRWVRSGAQTIGREEITEFSPWNPVRATKKLTEFGVWNRTLRNRIRPISECSPPLWKPWKNTENPDRNQQRAN